MPSWCRDSSHLTVPKPGVSDVSLRLECEISYLPNNSTSTILFPFSLEVSLPVSQGVPIRFTLNQLTDISINLEIVRVAEILGHVSSNSLFCALTLIVAIDRLRLRMTVCRLRAEDVHCAHIGVTVHTEFGNEAAGKRMVVLVSKLFSMPYYALLVSLNRSYQGKTYHPIDAHHQSSHR